jgi:putative tricarboxylic transport membrane protein
MAALTASSLLLVSCTAAPSTPSDDTAAPAESIPAVTIDRLEIWTVYPAGSGNHTMATIMDQALEKESIVKDVQVIVHEGGNGTTAISDIVTQSPKNTILVAGFGEVGASIIGNSERTLVDAAPIARLMGEAGCIVVPVESKIQNLDDFIAALKADPAAVSIAVGNRGGVDDIFVANLAKETGADPTKLNRVVFAGGGELMVALLGNQVAAGSTGYDSEVAAQVAAGKLRVIALSSDKPLESDPSLPALDSLGYANAATMNWRGAYAGPTNTAEENQAIIDVMTKMVQSQTWKDLAKQNDWIDNYISGAEFGTFLKSEYDRTGEVLRSLGLA